MELLGLIIVAIIVLIYSTVSWGFVSYKLYNWFILTAIPELPVFSVFQFMGFFLFINCIIRPGGTSIKDEYIDSTKAISGVILTPWLILLFSSIVRFLFL